MMKHLTGLAIAGVAALPVSVQAQQVHAPVGPRVEATVGWDRLSFDIDDIGGGKSGVEYGGEVGYDIGIGRGMILGAYAGIDGASTRDCIRGNTERLCLGAGRNIQLGGRVGARIGARSIAYVKGGYSNGRLTAHYTDSAFPADNFRDSDSGGGFHVGAGVELGLRGGFYGKAEYVYTRYPLEVEGGDDFNLNRNRVLAGFGYRF